MIVARVLQIRAITPEEGGSHRATLRPIATIAGKFDPSVSEELIVQFYAAQFSGSIGPGTCIKNVPQKGAIILAVIAPGFIEGDENKPMVFIVSDACDFMPTSAGLLTISGLGDARVLETLKKIREARARPVPNPYAPTTAPAKPATRPTN